MNTPKRKGAHQYRPELFSNFTPFINKLPDIDFDNDTEPKICVSFSRHFLPYIIGALELYQGGYVFDVPRARQLDISGIFTNLITELLTDQCISSDCVGQCANYYYPGEEWEVSPGLINGGTVTPPAGYAVNPWLTGDRVAIPGVSLYPSDVLTTLLQLGEALTFGALQAIAISGFPRIRYTFTSGPGTLEITLLKVPQGGRALIRLDDELTLDTVDLSSISFGDIGNWTDIIFQLLGIIGGGISTVVVPEEIVEKEILTTGEHHLDILMVPNLAYPDITSVGWGGGIRKIRICGPDKNCPDDDCPDCPDCPDCGDCNDCGDCGDTVNCNDCGECE